MRHFRASYFCSVLLLAGCVAPPDGWQPASDAPAIAGSSSPCGAPSLSLMTWNLQWFGDPGRGPDDEGAQLQGALETVHARPADLIALQELSTGAQVEALLGALPFHQAHVTDHAWPQQMALLYDARRFDARSAFALGELSEAAKAGRPPLVVELLDRATGMELHVVVVHARAGTDDRSWDARQALADALTEVVAAREGRGHATIILGDLNDGLTRSLVDGRPSPYARLLDFVLAPSAELESNPAGGGTTAWGATLDHILFSPTLAHPAHAWHVEVLPQSDDGTVSDHHPVVLKLALPSEGEVAARK